MVWRRKRQGIIWTNDGLVYWRIFASLGLVEFNDSIHFRLCKSMKIWAYYSIWPGIQIIVVLCGWNAKLFNIAWKQHIILQLVIHIMHRCWLYQPMYRLWVIVYQCKINTRRIAKPRKQFFILNNSSTQSPSRFHISGKTTILYQLKRNDPVTTIPACGFNVEAASPCSKGGLNFNVTVWDIGGQEKSRQLWKYCYKNTEGKPWPISTILV